METSLPATRSVTIGGKDYVLDGSFATLRAVQEAFKKDIVFVIGGILDMRLDEIATLIAVGSGNPKAADAIGQDILDTMDVMQFRLAADYYVLKTQLIAWLTVAICPRADREKKRAEMQTIIEQQTAPLPSPGENTASSA